MENEKTSPRVASIAGRVLGVIEHYSGGVVFVRMDGAELGRDVCLVRELRVLAASVLTQAPDKKKKKSKKAK